MTRTSTRSPISLLPTFPGIIGIVRIRQTMSGRHLFGSFQWQPNERLDITLDYQFSERDQRELRRDLQWGSTQEDISALTSDPSTGVVYSSISETVIHSFTTDFQRLEEYQGYGINSRFQPDG